MGSRATSSRVTVTVTPKSEVMGMGLGPAKSCACLDGHGDDAYHAMVIPRCGSIMSSCVRVIVSVSCWYA